MTALSFLLACDLDGTLIPAGVERLRTAAVSEFTFRFENRQDVALAYVTGRQLEKTVEAIEASGLPEPDYLACDVGTVLYRREGTTYKRDWGYAARVRQALGGVDAARIRQLVFECIPEVSPQEQDRQAEFKFSFYIAPAAAGKLLIRDLESSLNQAGARTNVIFSVDAVDGRGLLDILPREISKFSPVKELARELGLPDTRIVYAGDSEAALQGGFRNIVVGNAPDDLKARLRGLTSDRGLAEQVYFAEASHAAGVLEGCRRFGLIK